MADPTTVPTGIQPNLPAALSELGAALLLPALLIAVIAYFCGCFNGAVIVSKYILRDDVRTHGSGNAGLYMPTEEELQNKNECFLQYSDWKG